MTIFERSAVGFGFCGPIPEKVGNPLLPPEFELFDLLPPRDKSTSPSYTLGCD